MPSLRALLPLILILTGTSPAWAAFDMSAVIIDFPPGGPLQQDVEIISRDQETQYIATETYEVPNPGDAKENRVLQDDPQKSGLLITPTKLVLQPSTRKLMRFVLLAPAGDKEKIYRVVVKPVVQGLAAEKQRAALKLLVGYETLVMVRPQNAKAELATDRKGKKLSLTNSGDTNILLQSGQQCDQNKENCKQLDVARIYPGKSWSTELPYEDTPAKYTLWDGTTQSDKEF